MLPCTRICLAGFVALVLTGPSRMQAQTITFNGASADINFFYDSSADTWATVFRAKGTVGQPTTTDATGLTDPFNSSSTPATWPNIVGNIVPGTAGHTGDYVFTTLNINLNTSTTLVVSPVTFYLSPAAGSPFFAPTDPGGGVPDLGIRTRLRENPGPADQFASFNLTLNLASSTFDGNPLTDPGSPHVGLFHWDAFSNPISLINTQTSTLTANFGNFAHVHRNWGFSQYGTYSLAFDIEGVGGTYGPTASGSSFTMNFHVIPEPSTIVLMLGGLGVAWWLRKKRSLP